jgi:prophage maintenance system killer protein
MAGLVIYESKDGLAVSVKLEKNSVWLTQKQISELLLTSTDNVGLHLKNIYETEELEEKATTEDFSVVQQEGKRSVSRKIKHYNLDAIISVGYRVNSKRGTQFRQWANSVLKEHLIKGWTLDKSRFEQNAKELESALALIQKASHSGVLSEASGQGLIEVMSRYTKTFLWLQRYDEGLLTDPIGTKGGLIPTIQEVRKSIETLKKDLVKKGEASDLFGRERGDGLEAILGNLKQTVFGEEAYPTLEKKAAHLLYFIIKNHPLTDGNKRSAALLFVEFLDRNQALMRNGESIINDVGLAALALLIAESDPSQKELMIRLIENMLFNG